MTAQDYSVSFGYGAQDGYLNSQDIPLFSDGWFEITKDGYAQICKKVNGKRIRDYVHRVVMGAGKGEIVDHINGNRLDNRRENLRIVSSSQNVANSKLSSRNTSNYRNVYWQSNRSKWFVQFVINRKKYFFGYYENAEEAYATALVIRKQLYGKHIGVTHG